MAPSRKKFRRYEKGDGDSSSDEDDYGLQALPKDQEVIIDFEARGPQEGDFQGIEQLLCNLFPDKGISNADLAEAVLDVARVDVGCVLVQGYPEEEEEEDDDEDEEDRDTVLSVMTAVNMSGENNPKAVDQICAMLCNRCKEKEILTKLQGLIDKKDSKVALLINERYQNLPANVAAPSFEALLKDLSKAGCQYKYFLLICKLIEDADQEIWVNQEEEIIAEECETLFNYEARNEGSSTSKALRRVVLIPSTKFDSVLARLKTLT